MTGRTRKTMIASAFGEEIEYKTAGDYSVAGVLIYPDPANNFPRRIIAVGNSHASVTSRTRRIARQLRSHLLKSDEHHVMRVVPLTEATAPAVRDYFSTHNVVIDALYKPGQPDDGMMKPGWAYPWDLGLTSRAHALKGGQSMIRQLAKEGFTALAFRTAGGTRIADFQVTELLKSMNARKKG
jgi:hypothetical protein